MFKSREVVGLRTAINKSKSWIVALAILFVAVSFTSAHAQVVDIEAAPIITEPVLQPLSDSYSDEAFEA